MKNLVFVYGTLMKGYWNHGLLAGSEFISTATTVEKYVMFASSIPFVSQSQKVSLIHGELYSVTPETLSSLDALESYHPASPKSSWYNREEIEVELPTGEIRSALIYFNEKEVAPIVQSGNFRNLKEVVESPDDLWYFAYGSNMNPARMINRGVRFTRRIKGALNGYRLAFDKKAMGMNKSYANIHPEKDTRTLGILYRVSRKSLDKLDGFEGVSIGHYYRETLKVECEDGVKDAVVYIACEDKVQEGLCPTDEYLNHIRQGVDLVGEELEEEITHTLNFSRIDNY